MNKFPEDHPIESVRGLRRRNKRGMLRDIASRCAWLTKKLEALGQEHGWQHARKSFFADELATLVQCAEMIEEQTDGK